MLSRRIAASVDAFLPMYFHRLWIRSEQRHSLYVGLWSTWELGDDDMAAKIIIATVPSNVDSPLSIPLGDLKWMILQFQIVKSSDPVWNEIHRILEPEFDAMAAKRTRDDKACTNKLFYTPVQQNHSNRTLQNIAYLRDLKIQRSDALSESDPRPIRTLQRSVVPYTSMQNPEIRVFIEQTTSKNAGVDQLLHQETGLTNESNMLSAIGEWRTWIAIV